MRLLITILTSMFIISSCRAGLYDIKPDISEGELRRLYTDMLYKFTLHAETLWHEAGGGMGYWGTGRGDWNNEGVRAISTSALTYAVLVKHSSLLDKKQKALYINRALAGIRYAVNTHLTGAIKCTDGKQWGNSWQSTFWTANLGLAAWIVWNDSDPDLKQAVEKVVAFEADRLLTREPHGSEWRDTKAEENAWDQMVISLAANMFPEHPHAAGWREKSIQFMMNTISVPQDQKNESVVDGKPVKEWVKTVNAHTDYTVENHGFFHPSYTMVSPAMIGQGAFFYAFAGKPIPQAADHHLMDNWNMLQAFMLPHSYWAFVQGMDWALNSDGHIHYLAWLATYRQDPLAAGMEKLAAQYIAGHQKLHPDMTFAGPSSRLKFAREAITAERVAYSYLYHIYISSSPQQTRTIRSCANELNGVRRYIPIDTITHRTNYKFVSFSWQNKIMGFTMPIGEGHGQSPYFCTPITNGFIGSFVLESGEKGVKTEKRSWRKMENGFETEGVLLSNGDALKQEVRFASVGEKTLIYFDRVTAIKDVKITQELGVPIGIENDEFTGDRRTLYYNGGSRIILGPETQELITLPGNWANIDGRLGMVSLSGSGMTYRDVPNYNRDGAREDFLYGSYSETPKEYKAGSQVASRTVVIYLETSPEDTAKLVSRIKKDASGTVTVPLPEGGEWTYPPSPLP